MPAWARTAAKRHELRRRPDRVPAEELPRVGQKRATDMANQPLGPTGHTDTFVRDRLPPMAEWPELTLNGFDYPEWMNAAVELTDRMVEKGLGDNVALIGNGRSRT